MPNFYTTKEHFRRDLKKFIETTIADPELNAGDGRILLGEKENMELKNLLLAHGFSKRVLKGELDLFGLQYDEEKMILSRM